MENVIVFSEIAGAVVASVGLALGLEWISLNWLMHAMPGRSRSENEKHN